MKQSHGRIFGAALIFGLSIISASAFFPTPVSLVGLDPNERSTIAPINSLFVPGPFGFAPPLGSAIEALPVSAQAGAIDQLSPEKLGVFTSSLAFNNASFETMMMDSYLASQRLGPNGNFLGSNGGIDVSGLALNDSMIDPALASTHSRLLAWNPAPFSNGLLSDSPESVLSGIDMKDNKDMKSMASAYDDPWHFFVRGNVVLAQGFSDQDVPHVDENTESVVLGTDYRITPNLLIGLTASYAHTDATLDTFGSSATVDSYSPGLYAAYTDNGWYANLIGDYLHNSYTQSRVIPFLGQTANSAPEGNEGVADIDGGYDFHFGALKFGPNAGLQYTHLTVDGFTENGTTLANLTVNEQDSDSLRSRVGGDVSYLFSCHGVNVTPHLEAAWQHEFMDQARGITSSFNSGGGDFSVRTPATSRDSAIVDVGVDADLNRTVSVFTNYLVQTGQENYFGQSVQAGVKIGF